MVIYRNCKHLTLSAKSKIFFAKRKITEKLLPILKLNFGNPFFTKIWISPCRKDVAQKFFAYENMIHFLNSYSFWGLKISLSWRTMSLLLVDVVSKPIISPRVFAALFLFRRQGHIFERKLVLSFSMTHKLLKFYAYEVS